MLWLMIVACVGAYFCMKIPSWVEVTAGEIPTTLTYRDQPKPDVSARERARRAGRVISETIRQPLGRNVVTGLWGNGTIRILTGFLTLFIAFYASCLLYTSDAADERSSVDLGGRRIIKKKTRAIQHRRHATESDEN